MATTTEQQASAHGEGHGHQVTIIINGRRKTVEKGELSFEELVTLSGLPSGENITHTITYRHGPEGHREGMLAPGQTVKVKEGTVFDVRATDKS